MTSWIKCAKLGANESHTTRYVVFYAGFNMHKINFSLCPQARPLGAGLLTWGESGRREQALLGKKVSLGLVTEKAWVLAVCGGGGEEYSKNCICSAEVGNKVIRL